MPCIQPCPGPDQPFARPWAILGARPPPQGPSQALPSPSLEHVYYGDKLLFTGYCFMGSNPKGPIFYKTQGVISLSLYAHTCIHFPPLRPPASPLRLKSKKKEIYILTYELTSLKKLARQIDRQSGIFKMTFDLAVSTPLIMQMVRKSLF